MPSSAYQDPTQDNAWDVRSISLPGRGELLLRESKGKADAPPLFLLHGLAATGLLNWRPALETLAQKYRVLVVDHRGHGRGIRTRAPFRLADCADDVAAVADELGIERFFAAGYSMGGPIAQLTWKRHRARVRGLILCATACRFSSKEQRLLSFAATPAMNAIGRIAPRRFIRRIARNWLSEAIENEETRAWVMSEVSSSDPVSIGQATAAIWRFDSRDWIAEVDVPTSVILTERDNLVRPDTQRALADRIPGAQVFRIPGDHAVCVGEPELFVPALSEACASVVTRATRQA